MKKSVLFISLVCIMFSTSMALANTFEQLENLSPVQKQKLTQANQMYKLENNNLETRIMEYTDKLNRLKMDNDKTPEEKSVLIGAYERNLATFKQQQEQIKAKRDEDYKNILTIEQYEQFQAQQIDVQTKFNTFLQK